MKQKIMSSTILTNETGRSMVEMLGVLAVIGVLSVAGIAGFSRAMDKNRANTLINEAQKRATLVVPQIQLMGNDSPTLNEFTNNDLGYGEFDTKVYTNKSDNLPAGQFGIKLSGVSKDICQNILNTIGENTVIRRLSTIEAPTTAMTACGETNTFLMVYNNDMTSNAVAGEFDNRSSCTNAGFIYNNGQCASDMCDTCATEQSCLTVAGEKKCVSACPSGQTRDNETGTCSNNKCTDYTNCDEDYFCNFDSACATTGTCKKVSEINIVGRGTVVINNTEYEGIATSNGSLNSYFKAEDWCSAQGGRLPTAEETCTRNGTSFGNCEENDTQRAVRLQIIALNTNWVWTNRSDNNRTTCYAFSISASHHGTYEYSQKSDRQCVCLLPK